LLVSVSGVFDESKIHEKTEKKLRSRRKTRQNKFRIAWGILESIDDYVSAFDKDWNVIYVNKTAANSLGIKPEKLIGKNFWQTFPNLIGTNFEKNFQDVMTKRESRRFEWEPIYVKTGFREFTVFPSPDGVTVYGVDITQRKLLQRKLEEYTKNLEKIVEERTKKIIEGEQRYKELYESFGEAFIATDWELNIIHWNKAAEKITKMQPTQVLGKKIYDVFPEMASVDVTPYYEALQKKNPARFMMKTTSRQTKRPALFEISMYPSTQGMIIIVEDKTLEEETKRLSTIGQTAGMVGHDIRNPLQSIVSSMYIIKNDLEELSESERKKETLEELDSIYEQISYVDKIVSDLQDYARPLKPELVGIDVKSFVKKTLFILNIPENVKVLALFDEDLPILRTDPMLLKRVLINLATNAIQAMPQGGTLTVQANHNPKTKRINIAVKDTGIGIPQDAYKKLFKPLFTTKPRGQGFGLAVVKRLVEALGGTISFKSRKGKGTQFTIELPQ